MQGLPFHQPLRPELPAASEGFVVEHGRAAPNRARWRVAAMLLRCMDAALMLRWFGTEHQGVRRLLKLPLSLRGSSQRAFAPKRS